ncbi:hypothetical protein RJ639_003237 [Escallonia herrerae]|uniref:Uncharacterized protein n=1 Tax=Escallonia herrerae TaxID=1293975 RepID=A0AA88W653_9ASTE|nr:hypothetical protein RJ639_003237 [Escallonia herrerae]
MVVLFPSATLLFASSSTDTLLLAELLDFLNKKLELVFLFNHSWDGGCPGYLVGWVKPMLLFLLERELGNLDICKHIGASDYLVICAMLDSFELYVMLTSADRCVNHQQQQPVRELQHGRVSAEELVQAVHEMLFAAGINMDVEKQSLLQTTLTMQEQLQESQAALLLEQVYFLHSISLLNVKLPSKIIIEII